MSKKLVAKLVYFSFCTRVIVEEGTSDETIVDLARPMIATKVFNELNDNLDKIDLDIECPFDEMDTQTVFSESVGIIQISEAELHEDLLDRIRDMEEFTDEVVNVKRPIGEKIYRCDILKDILNNPEDDTNDNAKYHIEKLYERVGDFSYFMVTRV